MSIFNRLWARVSNGFIVELKEAEHELAHPFELLAGEVAVDVTKVTAAVGMHVDEKGNVASIPGRTDPLAPGESAYHDRSNPEPLSTSERERKVSTSSPLDLEDKTAQIDAAWEQHDAAVTPPSPQAPAAPAPETPPAPAAPAKSAKAA